MQIRDMLSIAKITANYYPSYRGLKMKRKKNEETMVEIGARTYAMLNLDEYMKHTIEPTISQKAAWSFAKTMPKQRSNVQLSRTWGETKVKSFTLTQRTRDWLEHATKDKQTGSKTVEVALCRYRMWRPLLDYIVHLTTELVEARKEIAELTEVNE